MDSPLVDVSALTVDDITAADSPALAASLKRVLDGLDDGVLSAFQSAMEFGSAIRP